MERSHEAEMRPTPSLDVASDLVHSPRTKSVCLQTSTRARASRLWLRLVKGVWVLCC